MVSIHTRAHTGPDGTLSLTLPTEFREAELEVLVVVNPVEQVAEAAAVPSPGWPEGYFEATFGSFSNDPIERLSQGEPELREALQ